MSDVWAFGCVLYEMLVGRRAFDGETVSELLASVLKAEPDWVALPVETPDAVRRLLRRCLQKDVQQRLRDIGDARIELEEVLVPPDGLSPGPSRPAPNRLALITVFALATIIAVVTIAIVLRPSAAVSETRIEISALPTLAVPSLAISPDGRKIAFESASEGRSRLWVRSLDTGQANPIPGTESLRSFHPFWSPDSQSIGFFTLDPPDNKLKRVDLNTGSVQTLALPSNPLCCLSGAWNRDGTILVGDSVGSISRISASGGELKVILRPGPEQIGIWLPEFLPDGGHFIYYAEGRAAARGGVYVSDLGGMAPRRLLDADTGAVYAASGHLLFIREQKLFAQKIDLALLATTGDAFLVADNVAFLGSKAALSASAAGPIVFRTGPNSIPGQLVWVDRSGQELKQVGAPHPIIESWAMSPDGRTLAFDREDHGNTDVWLFDMARSIASRFTSNPGWDGMPVWSPNGQCIVFNSQRSSAYDLYMKRVIGTGNEELLLKTPYPKWATDFSPDGRYLLYGTKKNGRIAVSALPLDPNCKQKGEPIAVAQTDFNESPGQFSPDGKWVPIRQNRGFRNLRQTVPGPRTGETHLSWWRRPSSLAA